MATTWYVIQTSEHDGDTKLFGPFTDLAYAKEFKVRAEASTDDTFHLSQPQDPADFPFEEQEMDDLDDEDE